MSKEGERNYLKKLGEGGFIHAINKPFSDDNCGRYLIDVGMIFDLLPKLPSKILDVGCGTGWTSCFFAKRGYDVVGIDIAEDMIAGAEKNKEIYQVPNVQFFAMDYEDMSFSEEFDGAVFYDALHHALDEELCLKQVFKSLKKGGVCVVFEPASGHHKSKDSLHAVKNFDVTEKEMHPQKVIKIAKKIGFKVLKVYPRVSLLQFSYKPIDFVKQPLAWLKWKIAIYFWVYFFKSKSGILVLEK